MRKMLLGLLCLLCVMTLMPAMASALDGPLPGAAEEPQDGLSAGEITDYHFSFRRNGHVVSSVDSDTAPTCKRDVRNFDYTGWVGDRFEISCYFSSRQYSGLITLDIPYTAQEGDEFRSTQKQLDNGLALYFDDDYLVQYTNEKHKLVTNSDFFRVKILEVSESQDDVILTGEFEGAFSDGALILEDGSFKVRCVK